jgi:hypothetical protein
VKPSLNPKRGKSYIYLEERRISLWPRSAATYVFLGWVSELASHPYLGQIRTCCSAPLSPTLVLGYLSIPGAFMSKFRAETAVIGRLPLSTRLQCHINKQ